MSQTQHIQKMLEELGMQNCKTHRTPMAEKEELTACPEPKPEHVKLMQKAAGHCLFLAIWTRPAAKGPRIIKAIVPIKPMWLLSRLPPKNNAKFASVEMAPAIVAVIVISSVS